MARFALDIVASIDKGMPLLGYDEGYNMAVICGYEDEGRTVLMRDYSRGDETNRVEADRLPPFLLFLTEYTGAASREDALKMALKLSVENFSRPDPVLDKGGAYHYGEHALAKWAGDIAHYDDYSQEEREILHAVSCWNFCSLWDARMAAASFLRQNLDLADLAPAADLYSQEAQILRRSSFERKEAFLGCWSGKSIADWTLEVRQREIDLLNQAREMETEAIGLIAVSL